MTRPSTSTTPTASRPAAPRRSLGLRPKDWISVGVYAVLYIVLIYACGMLGYVPFIYPFCGFLYGIVCQTPVLLLALKVRHLGALTVLGLLTGAIAGFGMPVMILVGLAVGFVADLVALSGRYVGRIQLVLACGVFNLMFYSGYAMFFFNRNSTMAMIAKSYGQDYVDQVSTLLPQWYAYVMPVGLFVAGCVGALIALRLMRKHFERAGLV